MEALADPKMTIVGTLLFVFGFLNLALTTYANTRLHYDRHLRHSGEFQKNLRLIALVAVAASALVLMNMSLAILIAAIAIGYFTAALTLYKNRL